MSGRGCLLAGASAKPVKLAQYLAEAVGGCHYATRVKKVYNVR